MLRAAHDRALMWETVVIGRADILVWPAASRTP